MRKLYNCMVASLLFLAVSCQQEEIASVEPGTDLFEVYASIEDIDDEETRTYLSGNEVYWSSGDKIAVFYKNTLRKRFDVTPESIDSKNATFLLDEGYVQMGSNVNVSHNVAYYPFCEVTCAPDGSSYTLSNLTLPSTQSYVEGSVGLGAFPMVAVTENTDDVNFCFKNICGVMQFQLKGSGFVKSVSVRGNRGEVLAGSAVVTAGYGKEPSISMSAEGVKEVTLDCGESGVELNETTPVSFFIVLPPVQFEGGFTITVTDTWGGSKEYSTAKKNPIVRSKGLRMPSKEYIGVRPPQEGDYIDEYGVNHGQGVEIDGVVWAPVNCGYHKDDFRYGKLYQWGRKYGQGYEGDLWEGESKTDQNYADAQIPTVLKAFVYMKEYQASENANVFFDVPQLASAKYYPHWRSTLWNHGTEESPIKSEYDPCPDGWRVPTLNELTAMVSNVVWGQNDGLYGSWISNSSAEKFFLPAAGLTDYSYFPSGRGNCGSYWCSKSVDGTNYGYIFGSDGYFDSYSLGEASWSVRCVKDDTEVIFVESISINKTELTLSVGTTETLSASFLPANANHKEVYWYSKDNWVATVDASGKIEAKGVGTVTITAMAGMQTAECEVTVLAVQEGDYIDEYGVNHGQGIEIDGVVWAPVNCGYKAPTADSKGFPYGKLYQWGRKYGQGYDDNDESYPSGDDFVKGPISPNAQSERSAHEFIYFLNNGQYNYPYDWANPHNDKLWNSGTESNPVKTEYDPCPAGWRVPLRSELEGLCTNYSCWTSNESGMMGYWFSGSNPYGSDILQLFLPAAGTRSGIVKNAEGKNRDVKGSYYSSRYYRNSSDGVGFLGAYYLDFDSATVSVHANSARALAYSVRCVQE